VGAARVEIAFYSQDEASVFLEASVPAEDQEPTELALFVHYVIRQFANLRGDAAGLALAQAISKVGYEPGQRSIREMLETVKVVRATGAGRKGFKATLDSDTNRFTLNQYGFGVLGKELRYYSPVSALVLLDCLWSKHTEDGPFLNGLIMALMQLSTVGHTGVTTPANQASLAVSVLKEALPIYKRERAAGSSGSPRPPAHEGG
jgi:hypothetical protein